LTAKVDSQFSIFVNSTPELRGRWATVGLLYEDPLYGVNYAYGGLLALKYYQLYSTKHDWFVPRYVAMLKNGFDAPPAELLKRFLEIDMPNSQLLEDDLALLNSRLDLLEK
jgi:oligoendopeptidase F